MNVYLIRHAQGYHNIKTINKENLKIMYPIISSLGHEQIKSLKGKIEDLMNLIDLVIVSPTTRTLQTAVGAFDVNKYKFIAHESIREVLHNPCDYRKKISELKNDFDCVDFSLVQEEDNLKLYETDDLIYKRCDEFYKWLLTRKEKNIAIVSHNGFLFRFMKKYGNKLNLINKNGFKNCELRIGYIKKKCLVLIDVN